MSLPAKRTVGGLAGHPRGNRGRGRSGNAEGPDKHRRGARLPINGRVDVLVTSRRRPPPLQGFPDEGPKSTSGRCANVYAPARGPHAGGHNGDVDKGRQPSSKWRRSNAFFQPTGGTVTTAPPRRARQSVQGLSHS